MYKDTEELLKKLKLEINPRAKLGSLSIAQMQMVEIAKAVSANCKVLILDEPTSSLTANEVESLFRIMRELKALGVALVYISHKMDEIKRIADDITIMRDGTYVGTWSADELSTDDIIAKMVGRTLTNVYPERKNTPGEVIMEVKHMTSISDKSFQDVSFNLRKVRSLFRRSGRCPENRGTGRCLRYPCFKSGEVTSKEEVTIKHPADAMKAGIGLITEDRRGNGIFGCLSIKAT